MAEKNMNMIIISAVTCIIIASIMFIGLSNSEEDFNDETLAGLGIAYGDFACQKNADCTKQDVKAATTRMGIKYSENNFRCAKKFCFVKNGRRYVPIIRLENSNDNYCLNGYSEEDINFGKAADWCGNNGEYICKKNNKYASDPSEFETKTGESACGSNLKYIGEGKISTTGYAYCCAQKDFCYANVDCKSFEECNNNHCEPKKDMCNTNADCNSWDKAECINNKCTPQEAINSDNCLYGYSEEDPYFGDAEDWCGNNGEYICKKNNKNAINPSEFETKTGESACGPNLKYLEEGKISTTGHAYCCG
ncbi:hypothetical protein HOK51_06190 [Candidatus Woesearchaeota archaeon]|nr:hypothetical protein [Candidatus Woesearchaeota archaeon]MBT6519415.1 hypothetical protein [Candidatus Woesearchaeota archaeon]MBT7368924.1 hypothetical protein [Candidatus Woesearchaeota archaeon]